MSKNRNRILLAVLIIALTSLILCIVLASTSFAVEPSVELYQKWNLQKSDMMWSFLRKLGWVILMGARNIVNGVEYMFSESIRFLSFGLNENINNFIADNINPFIAVLLGIGLTFFGISIMLLNVERNKLVINFMLLLVALFGLPLIMTQFTDITMLAMESFSTGNNVTSENEKPLATADIFLQNVIDFRYLDENNFNEGLKRNNNLKQYSYHSISIDETIEPNSNLKNPDIFKKEVSTNASGELEVVNADFGGWFGIGAAHYYRYNFDFISISLMLLSSFFVFIFLSFKTLRLAFEIAYGRVLAILVSPVDITSGAKTKKILIEILTLFVSLIFVAILYRFFLLGSNYISTAFPNPFVRAMFILFLALVVIDGPNLVEKVMGIDIGVKSSVASIMSLLYAANTAKNLFSGMGHIGARLSNRLSGDSNSKNNSSSTSDSSSDNVYHQGDNQSNETNDVNSDSNNAQNTSNDSYGVSSGVPYSGNISFQQPVPDTGTSGAYTQSNNDSSSYNTNTNNAGNTQNNDTVYSGSDENTATVYANSDTTQPNNSATDSVYSNNSSGEASERTDAASAPKDIYGSDTSSKDINGNDAGSKDTNGSDTTSKPYSHDNKTADMPSGEKGANSRNQHTPANSFDPKSQNSSADSRAVSNPKIHYGDTTTGNVSSSPASNSSISSAHNNNSNSGTTDKPNADKNIYSPNKNKEV